MPSASANPLVTRKILLADSARTTGCLAQFQIARGPGCNGIRPVSGRKSPGRSRDHSHRIYTGRTKCMQSERHDLARWRRRSERSRRRPASRALSSTGRQNRQANHGLPGQDRRRKARASEVRRTFVLANTGMRSVVPACLTSVRLVRPVGECSAGADCSKATLRWV
jgi:hypothetical protein